MAMQKQQMLWRPLRLLLLLLMASAAATQWNFEDESAQTDIGLAGGSDFADSEFMGYDEADSSYEDGGSSIAKSESSYEAESEVSSEEIDYGYEDGGSGFEDGGSGFEDGGSGFEDGGYGYEDGGYGYEDGGYGFEDGGYGFEDGGSGFEDGGSGFEDGGSGFEDGGSGFEDGEYGYEDGGYDFEDGGYGFEDDGYGFEDDGYGYEDGGYGYEDGGYGFEDDGYGYEDGGYGYEDGGYGYEDGGYGYEDGGYGYEDGGYGYEDGGYGYEDEGYGYEDGGYGYEDGGYGFEDDGYGFEDDGYGFEDDGYGFEFEDDFGGGRRGRGPRRGGRPVQVRAVESAPGAELDAGGPEIEFDDGSASPDEIPPGYFSQEEAGNGPPPRAVIGGIDLPGFRVVIGDALHWWKYDVNVCLRKEILRPREFEDADSHLSMYSMRCGQNSVTEYSCIFSQWNGAEATSQRLNYTCCSGFTRLSGDRGCPRNSVSSSTSSRTFTDLLRSRGYSSRAIDLFSTVMRDDKDSRQWTVFVPDKEALETAIDNFEVITRLEQAGLLVRKVLNHFAEPALTTQSMRHGQLVATQAKPSSLLISKTSRGSVLVNCQPLVEPNQAFNRCSIAHFTTGVLRINKLNLYQLMLQRLANFTSPSNATRLLAPLKSTLTANRPLTVFMHSPATDEIANGCYARNLRAVIVKGVECNTSMALVSVLRTIDGRLVRVERNTRSEGRAGSLLIDGNRLVEGADQLASNGVLHLVRTTESLTGFSNEVTRRLKSSPEFRPLFSRPNRTEGDIMLLMPPIDGSYSYTDATRWNNLKFVSFGRQHLIANATNCLRASSIRIPMLDGVPRDFVQLFQRTSGVSIFSPGRLVRRRFVDCVPVMRTAKDCGGTVYFLLGGELPSFNSSPTALDYLSSSGRDSYSMTKTILNFGILNNINGLEVAMRRTNVSILLVKDVDLVKLSGPLLLRRRRPTRQQMTELVQWFTRYFVASRKVCAVKQINTSLRVPVFRIDRRPCRSFVCAMRRQMTREMKLVLLRPGGQVTVREGFLLPGRVAQR